MVAPTRTPQARGVKCELCKRVLATATWLDQTKLAKTVDEAQQVLKLMQQHDKSKCPCIPQDIRNLLIGSTHFEIHRIVIKNIDAQIHKRQYEFFRAAKQKAADELSKSKNQNINDCKDSHKSSRFNLYPISKESKDNEKVEFQLMHLTKAIDCWKSAMEDPIHQFNSKLALRLGLTHHVIYASYLFKYYRILDYQLITANLLLNLFRTIEGVTIYAVLHANYLAIKALMDSDQFTSAKQYLNDAVKISNYTDKSHYESILLTCAALELDLLNGGDPISLLDELSKLTKIRPDDKLQHYYARTLAMSIIIKYIQYFKSRSNLCFEFYHTFRYISAIIRRCYENSFALVLSHDVPTQTVSSIDDNSTSILNHTWIKFAVCDFVYSTFDLLTNFYIRSGQPEGLEILYNGLNLISYRNGSCYWQTRLASIGISLDLLCDKSNHAKEKMDFMKRTTSQVTSDYLRSLIRMNIELSELNLLNDLSDLMKKDAVMKLEEEYRTCQSITRRLSQIELYDCKSRSYFKSIELPNNTEDTVAVGTHLSCYSLLLFKLCVRLLLNSGKKMAAKELVVKLGNQMATNKQVVQFNENLDLLDVLLNFLELEKSERHLLDVAGSTDLVLRKPEKKLNIESLLSNLTLDGDREKNQSRKKDTKLNDTITILRQFSSLTDEEILQSYLRNSEPAPDYLTYRRVHEMMFSILSKNNSQDHERVLYHFTEASTANTMRYRWMMFEEQQAQNGTLSSKSTSSYLAFSCATLKSRSQSVPVAHRLVQIKYLIDKTTLEEHFIIACIGEGAETIYINVSYPIGLNDMFEKPEENSDHLNSTTPKRFWNLIEAAKKTLFNSNSRSRSESRQKIESELGIILHDIENEWLGPFKFVLCGRICDRRYNDYVSSIEKEILSIMAHYTCKSEACLKMMLENAPLLTRDEFCQAISSIFDSPLSLTKTRDCFNKWLKSLEKFIAIQAPGLKKDTYLRTLARNQVGLILDKELEHIPFESLPMFKRMNQGLFRVPSLRFYNLLSSRNSKKCSFDANETAYILDPAGNLAKTRERFEGKLSSQKAWTGTIGRPPSTEQLEQWLLDKQIYMFIGHGAGTTYCNNLCKGKGLSAMSSVRPMSIVMGCSSGRVLAEGPKLESFGINWIFILRGGPAYVGLLWDVTDTDIDRFLDSLLSKWLGSVWNKKNESTRIALTEAVSHARDACQLRLLVGSTPVVYGLPVDSTGLIQQ